MNSTTAVEPRTDDDRYQRLGRAMDAVNGILLGKDEPVRLAFACMLSRGHLLIEDLPGVGKTTLAHALARVIGARYSRIQFTSDLMPADILGVSIYRRDEERFEFHPGPIFSEVVLADEVNRATPKSQSALLEAMAEGQVTVEGETHTLPNPFFVIATQNPLDLVGTFPLPESQLDRFLLSIWLGYPEPEVERELLVSEDRSSLLRQMKPELDLQDIAALQQECRKVHTSDALLDYVQALIEATRSGRWFPAGLSPRAGIMLLQVSRAHAFLAGREFVIPEDVKAVFPSLARHRLTAPHGVEISVDQLLEDLLEQVAVH